MDIILENEAIYLLNLLKEFYSKIYENCYIYILMTCLKLCLRGLKVFLTLKKLVWIKKYSFGKKIKNSLRVQKA